LSDKPSKGDHLLGHIPANKGKDKRRETILKSLEERDLLTEEQKEKILAAETLTWRESVSLCP
jgi:hypothetical protein